MKGMIGNMEIIREKNENTEVIRIKGRLDTTTSPQLHTVLADALSPTEKIEIDFAGVEYVSSAGLRVLLQIQKNAQQTGKTMTLMNVSSDVMEVFEMTGFSGILNII